MDDKSFNIRIPKRWVRVAMIVGVTALIVAPLTAIASHSFTDVPNSNTFHSDIEWMKDAGVTQGCNPPDNTEYCPDDNVTRGQMAAFMNRFAGYIGAEDGTPTQADHATTADSATTASDADTLDGKNSATYTSPIWGTAIDWQADGQGTISGSIPSGNEILTFEVYPPTDGVLSLTYNLGVFDTTEDYYGGAWLQYNNSTCSFSNRVLGSSAYFDSEGTTTDKFEYVTGGPSRAQRKALTLSRYAPVS